MAIHRPPIRERLVSAFAAFVVALGVTFLVVGILVIVLYGPRIEHVPFAGMGVIALAFLAAVVAAVYWAVVGWFTAGSLRSARLLLVALGLYGLGLGVLMVLLDRWTSG